VPSGSVEKQHGVGALATWREISPR
jgi:hypothetical protein